ncbi:MAG: DNA polymerase IV [Deltaproteobacteria bacterium]
MNARAVIYIRIGSFFSSVEALGRPGTIGSPMVVGSDGDPAGRGTVAGVSPEADELGIRPGMTLKKARQICPEALFVPMSLEVYEKASDTLMSLLREFSPMVESFGLDEAFIEPASGPDQDASVMAVNMAREIKAAIRKSLRLTPTVGVGPNKLMAWLAGAEAPVHAGFFAIHEKETAAFLRTLPVGRLPFVSTDLEKRLLDLNLKTVGDLSRAHISHLDRYFGKDVAAILYGQAKGVDENPVVSFHEKGALCKEAAFSQEVKDQHLIRETLYALTEDISARLRTEGSKASSFSIKIGYAGFRTATSSVEFPEPVDSLNDIWKGALKLLDAELIFAPVRLVGVKLSGLE